MHRARFASKAPRGALLAVSFLLLAGSRATAGVSIAIVPPYAEKLVAGGTSVSDTISFTNRGSEPVLVSVDLSDFRVGDQGDVSEEPPGSQDTSLVPYLRISPTSMRVAPNQQASFRYVVETPEEFRQLRAMLYFSSLPETPAKANQVRIVPRMGVPLYVENTKAGQASLRVDHLEWQRSAESPDQLLLELTTENQGARNIRPTGFVSVRTRDGKFERSFPFNEGREPVLPGQMRQWRLAFGPVPTGELDVQLRVATSLRTSYESRTWVPAAND